MVKTQANGTFAAPYKGKEMMDWIEEKRDGYSVFKALDRFTLEPEDLDFDEWSLYDNKNLVGVGSRAECETLAKHRSRLNEVVPSPQAVMDTIDYWKKRAEAAERHAVAMEKEHKILQAAKDKSDDMFTDSYFAHRDTRKHLAKAMCFVSRMADQDLTLIDADWEEGFAQAVFEARKIRTEIAKEQAQCKSEH